MDTVVRLRTLPNRRQNTGKGSLGQLRPPPLDRLVGLVAQSLTTCRDKLHLQLPDLALQPSQVKCQLFHGPPPGTLVLSVHRRPAGAQGRRSRGLRMDKALRPCPSGPQLAFIGGMNDNAEVIDRLRLPTRELRRAAPEAWAAFAKLHEAAVADGVLPARIKELIALSIAVV